MKKDILTALILLFFSVLTTTAQPTLSSNNNPLVGESYYYRVTDTIAQPGPSGSGQTWNYTGVQVTLNTVIVHYVAPSSTPYYAAFGKDQSQLRADQAAALVGSFQNPRIYNLLQDDVTGQRKSEKRTDEVLKDLQRAVGDNAFPDFFLERFVNDVVNENDLEKLKEYNTIGTVNKKWSKRLPSGSLIPYATHSLIKEANSIIRDQQLINNVDYGMSYEPNVADGGCKITTTINAKLHNESLRGSTNTNMNLRKIGIFTKILWQWQFW